MSAPLLAVSAVFRCRLGVSSLDHVIAAVTEYLDSSVELPLSTACRFNSLRVLDRIWTSVDINLHDVIPWSLRNNETYYPLSSSSLEELDEASRWSVRRLMRSERCYQQLQFTSSLSEAARLKSLEMVQWIFSHMKDFVVTLRAVEEAAAVGALDILQYYRANDIDIHREKGAGYNQLVPLREVEWGGNEVEKAALGGHRETVLWLCEDMRRPVVPYKRKVLKAAVASGDVELLEYLVNRYGKQPREGYFEAAANGHVGMLRWWTQSCYEPFKPGMLFKASQAGRLNVVQWVIENAWNGGESDSDDDAIEDIRKEVDLCIHAAAINGHLAVAKFLCVYADTPLLLHSSGDFWEHPGSHNLLEEVEEELGGIQEAAYVSAKTMVLAAQRGYLDVVQWLYEEFGTGPYVNLLTYTYGGQSCHAMDAAAENGHLEVVRYLASAVSQMEPSSSVRAMDGAASRGHLNVVQWLHNNRTEGCTTDAMDGAATNGHLEVVEWLHTNRNEGCTIEAMDGAASNGHLDVVEWLHTNRNEGCTIEAMDGAASGGHLDVVKWLHENRSEGCTTKAMDGAAACGALDVVRWLHRNRSEGCTSLAMDEAARHGHRHVLRWLHENRTEGCTTSAMDNAALSCHFETVMMLSAARSEGCTNAVQDVPHWTGMVSWLAEGYPALSLIADDFDEDSEDEDE